jgi:uncharacterized protein with GYD domain
MQTFIMFGQYSAEALKGISVERTKQTAEVMNKLGGKVIGLYVLLGEIDIVLIVELPGMDEAIEASVSLNRITGIDFSTYAGMPVDQFDRIMASA